MRDNGYNLAQEYNTEHQLQQQEQQNYQGR